MKVYLDSIGCRLNQAEIEKFASQFHAQGHEIVASPADADLVVINTCSVTNEAASDSRQKIRQAAKAGCQRIIPVGCLSTLDGDVLRNLHGVDLVIPNSEKDNLVNQILGTSFTQRTFGFREPVQGSRKRVRAFIKAQDGCDQHCTYCITRLARGKSRSIPVDDVIADIRAAEKSGVKEAVLSGVQLGSWGRDLFPSRDIAWLVRCVLRETSIPRLRLSSIEPWDIPEGFFSLWKDPRLCAQLHLPLQSGSKRTLKRMGRPNTPDSYRAIAERIRKEVPGIAITTDIIVGFPGETEEEFEESLEFVASMEFAGGHVFQYSPRKGTAAVLLPGQVDPGVKRGRSSQMRNLFTEAGRKFQEKFIGHELNVLWESDVPLPEGTWLSGGLTGNYLRVTTTHQTKLINNISVVQMDRIESGVIRGHILTSGD
jgi:threonylcarbamoyladenosine tRNA methylthiotransferase MtaB